MSKALSLLRSQATRTAPAPDDQAKAPGAASAGSPVLHGFTDGTLNGLPVRAALMKDGQVLMVQLDAYRDGKGQERQDVGVLKIGGDGRVRAQRLTLPSQGGLANPAILPLLAAGSESPDEQSEHLVAVARAIGLGQPGLAAAEDADAHPGKIADVLRALRLEAFAALKAAEKFGPAEHAYYAANGDKGKYRRQAAASYPMLASVLPMIVGQQIDAGKALEPELVTLLNVDKRVIRAIQGKAYSTHGLGITRIVQALNEIDPTWFPANEADWKSFCDAVQVVGTRLRDITGLPVSQLYQGLRGKVKGAEWTGMMVRLSEVVGMARGEALLGACLSISKHLQVKAAMLAEGDPDKERYAAVAKNLVGACRKLIKQLRQGSVTGEPIDQALVAAVAAATDQVAAVRPDDYDLQDFCGQVRDHLGDEAGLLDEERGSAIFETVLTYTADMLVGFANRVVKPLAGNAVIDAAGQEFKLLLDNRIDRAALESAAELLFPSANAATILESARRFHFEQNRVNSKIHWVPPEIEAAQEAAEAAGLPVPPPPPPAAGIEGEWPCLTAQRTTIIEPKREGARRLAIRIMNTKREYYVHGMRNLVCIGWNRYWESAKEGRHNGHFIAEIYDADKGIDLEEPPELRGMSDSQIGTLTEKVQYAIVYPAQYQMPENAPKLEPRALATFEIKGGRGGTPITKGQVHGPKDTPQIPTDVKEAADEFLRAFNAGEIPRNPELDTFEYKEEICHYNQPAQQVVQLTPDPIRRNFDDISSACGYDWRNIANIRHVIGLYSGQVQHRLGRQVPANHQLLPAFDYIPGPLKENPIQAVLDGSPSAKSIMSSFDPDCRLLRGDELERHAAAPGD